MKNRVLLSAGTFLLAAGLPAAVLAGPPVRLEVGPSLSYLSAEAGWRIRFPSGYAPSGALEWTVSELEFREMNGLLPSLHLSLEVEEAFSLRLFLRHAAGLARVSGAGTDSDYVEVAGQRTVFSRSSFSAADQSTALEAQLVLPLDTWRFAGGRITASGLAGYLKSIDRVRIREGVQLVSNDPAIPPAGSRFPALDSTYTCDWDSLMAGLGLAFERGPWTLGASLSVLQNYYSGEGFWNLRTYAANPDEFAWRNQPPNYLHYGANGGGYRFAATAGRALSGRSALTLAYEQSSLAASGGRESLFFHKSIYNDSSSDIVLDEVHSRQNALTLALSFRF